MCFVKCNYKVGREHRERQDEKERERGGGGACAEMLAKLKSLYYIKAEPMI